jgi:hypothetical protein
MAFIDKLGQVANKVSGVASDTFDYGKTKTKILLERGKIKDVKEAIGTYAYEAFKADGQIDINRIAAFCAEIDEHKHNIETLEASVKKHGENVSDISEDTES